MIIMISIAIDLTSIQAPDITNGPKMAYRSVSHKKAEIPRAISTDLTGRSHCNRCQTIELWPLDPAEQVSRDASGFAEQGGISISCFVNPALFWDFSGEIV
jgi:hypothetical protein